MTTDETHSLGACLKHWRLQKGLPLEVIALKTRIPLKYLRALESNDYSTLPPIEPVHHTLGELLREYRERQGLSLAIIAERTRVPLATLHALEQNNSKNLPEAPVIIRAFVDAYLNCLTLEEAEKEIVLLQFGRMVDTVYTQPRQASSDPPLSDRMQPPHISRIPFNTWCDQQHDRALGIYVRFIDWRAAFCRNTVSAGQRSLAFIDHFLDRTRSLCARAGLTASHKIAASAVEFIGWIRPDGGWAALWQRTITALIVSAQQVRRAWVSVRGALAPLFQWSFLRRHLIETRPSLDHRATAVAQNARPQEEKPWVWLVQYGMTVLLLILLGSTAATIPLFKDTALVGTKLTASNLVAFIGYGGAFLMVWLMGRKAVTQLVPCSSAFAFLRPLGAPFNALFGVSASYKILLTLLGPSLGKADRLAYNWIFVSLILAATFWLIRNWFLKSAPLLDSLEDTSHSKRPGGIAVASLRD